MRFAVVVGCISMMGCTFIVNKQAAPSIVAPTASPTPSRTPASSVKPLYDLNSTSDDLDDIDVGKAAGQVSSGLIEVGSAAMDTVRFARFSKSDNRSIVYAEADVDRVSPDCLRGLVRTWFHPDQKSQDFARVFAGAWAACPELRHGAGPIEPRGADESQYVKDLTEGAATRVVSLPVEPGQSITGTVSYVVSASDERRYQYQARQGHVSFWVSSDKDGTETCQVTGDDRGENPTQWSDGSTLVATDGVMGYTWAASTYPKNGCELTLNAWSSLQQTKFQIFAVTFSVHSGQSNAVWADPPAVAQEKARASRVAVVATSVFVSAAVGLILMALFTRSKGRDR